MKLLSTILLTLSTFVASANTNACYFLWMDEVEVPEELIKM